MTTSTALTAIDVLQQTRELLTPLDAWTKGEWIERTWDEETNDYSDKVQACSMGAMLLAEGMADFGGLAAEGAAATLYDSDKAFRKATKTLAKAIRKDLGFPNNDLYEEKDYIDYVIVFNDDEDTTHEDVLAAFDAAIERLKK